MFFFRRFSLMHSRPPNPALGTGLAFNGLLCLLFGLAIIVAPELLAYIVATFLILIGVTLLTMAWKIRR